MKAFLVVFFALFSFSFAHQYYLLQVPNGHAVALPNGSIPDPLIASPLNLLDKWQHWYFQNASQWNLGTGSYIVDRLFSLVFDVENERVKPSQTVLDYYLKNDTADSDNQRFEYDDDTFLLHTEIDTSYIVVADESNNIVIQPQWAWNNYSFKLIPAPEEREITIYNGFSYDLTLLFVNAPASEPQITWSVPANSNTTYTFLDGSILDVTDSTTSIVLINSLTVDSSAGLLLVPSGDAQCDAEDSKSLRTIGFIGTENTPAVAFPDYSVGEKSVSITTPEIGSSDFTFYAVVTPTSPSFGVIATQFSSTAKSHGFEVMIDSSNNVAVQGLGINLGFPFALPLNVSSTIGVVREGAVYRLFFNGREVTTAVTKLAPLSLPAASFQLGSTPSSQKMNIGHFVGSISSAKLFLSALESGDFVNM